MFATYSLSRVLAVAITQPAIAVDPGALRVPRVMGEHTARADVIRPDNCALRRSGGLLPSFQGNYLFFAHLAPGPRPIHSTLFPFWPTRTRRTISRLTPGEACCSCATSQPPWQLYRRMHRICARIATGGDPVAIAPNHNNMEIKELRDRHAVAFAALITTGLPGCNSLARGLDTSGRPWSLPRY